MFKGSVLSYNFQSHTMPKATKKSAHGNNTFLQESEVPSSPEDTASSDKKYIKNQTQKFHSIHLEHNMQFQTCLCHTDKVPKMGWTVNDALYHRFLKWHLKCENIPDCKLVALPEQQKCKKVIAWSGDFGMSQYVSWGLSSEDLGLDTI